MKALIGGVKIRMGLKSVEKIRKKRLESDEMLQILDSSCIKT
jgi:hypothetical protein